MSGGRTLTIGLIVAIVLMNAWQNGRLRKGAEALWGPFRPLGKASA